MNIDELITVEPYDPAWATQFARERDILCQGLSVKPSRVEHIGSTAISGMHAKPIVDIGELATRVGYTSEAAFNRRFKRMIGITPGAARASP